MKKKKKEKKLERARNGQTGKGQKSCFHPDSAPISLANSNLGHHLSFWLVINLDCNILKSL